jgi:hypothetical protein
VAMEQNCAKLAGETDVNRATAFIGTAILEEKARTVTQSNGQPAGIAGPGIETVKAAA